MATLTIPDNIFSRLKRLADRHRRTADEEGAVLLGATLAEKDRDERNSAVLNEFIRAMRSKQKRQVDHHLIDRLKSEGRA